MRIQLLHPPALVSPGNLMTSRPTPPLGLAYVAAALRRAGHECVLLDAVGEAAGQRITVGKLQRIGLSDEQIVKRIDPDADAIAIGNMFSFNWLPLRGVIRAIHERWPDKIIVCGGEHFSALPQLCMEEAPIDYIVVGEGEEIAIELFDRLGAGADFDPATIRGLCWRRGTEVVQNQRAERTKAVDEIPWPAWDLFDLDAYNRHNLVGGLRFGKAVPIMATRGCPYQCTYCSSPSMWTTRWYTREPVDVADEIEFYVKQYGADSFPFQDLTMIVKRDWIIAFCNEIIRRQLSISWQLPSGTRCEVVDDEVAELLRRSGCRWLCYAPESGSERTRELIKKKMKTSSLLNAVDAAVRAKLRIEAFIVMGFPHDTRADLRGTLRLVRALARRGVEDIATNFFFPVPGTELFEYLEGSGRIGRNDLTWTMPIYGHKPALDDERNFCEHLSAMELTGWKYLILANFYLTGWLTHPTRLPRILFNAVRGRETTALEKFLGERLRTVVKQSPELPARLAVAALPQAPHVTAVPEYTHEDRAGAP